MKRAKFPKAALWYLGFLLLLALGRDLIANGRPLYCKIGNEHFFPGIRTLIANPQTPFQHPVLDSLRKNNAAWKTYPYDKALFAPIPFSPGEWFSKPACPLAPPLSRHPDLSPRFVHWLGTDEQGRDVAAGMVSGARIALLTGFLAMGIAYLLGALLGSLAGFFGDDQIETTRAGLLASCLALALLAISWIALAPVFSVRGASAGWINLSGIAILTAAVWFVLKRFRRMRIPVAVPVDLLIMRTAEIFNAIPRLILLVALAALAARQSTWVLIALIGFFSWPGIAVFIRAELLRIRSLDYITAARLSGFSRWRILFRHALPNALQPSLVAAAFGVGNAIVLEASLSFLGFGGAEFAGASWGSLLKSIVNEREAWWMAVPPGLAIALTVLSLNSLGEYWSSKKT